MPQIAVPLHSWQTLNSDLNWLNTCDVNWLNIIVRVREGIEITKSESTLQPLYSRAVKEAAEVLGTKISPRCREILLQSRIVLRPCPEGINQLRSAIGKPVMIFGAMAALVYLVVCVNVATLLFIRNAARQHDTVVRMLLGATRRLILAQLLVEGATLVAIAAVCAAIVHPAILKYVITLLPENTMLAERGMHLGFGGALFLAACALIAVIIGVGVPSIHTTSPSRTEGGNASGMGFVNSGKSRLRRAMMVLQVALAVFLLAAAVAFVSSFR
jgi:hypothetical protein